jgi:NAD(P)-dependent dehydrogenase (short-subunit alcohol dehydrogenase family)
LVTRTNSSIARAIALELAQAGAKVAVNYVMHPETAAGVVADIEAGGQSAMAVKADVTSREEAEAMFVEIDGVWSDIDLLVNRAGVDGPLFRSTRNEPGWEWVPLEIQQQVLRLLARMLRDRPGNPLDGEAPAVDRRQHRVDDRADAAVRRAGRGRRAPRHRLLLSGRGWRAAARSGRGSGANFSRSRTASASALRRSGRKHHVPDRGRGLALKSQATKIELALADSMQQLHAGNRHRRAVEELEAEHGLDA